jgi:hypothetical protein
MSGASSVARTGIGFLEQAKKWRSPTNAANGFQQS